MKNNTLLYFLQKKGIFIDAACGGRGRCGRCRVLIKENPEPPDEIEKHLIPERLIKKGYRLACRYRVKRLPEMLKIGLSNHSIGKCRRLKSEGMAIDIGTTIIKGAVVDLAEGKIVKMAKVYNPQQSFGGDVITRVGIANNGKYPLLKKALENGIKELKARLGCKNPLFMTVVGNPVMLSFYLGKSVENFGHYPFSGEVSKGVFVQKPPGYVFGCIGGFVGGDTIAGIIASGLLQAKKPSLYIDLGTNGEIALLTDKKIYALSTSAGPAFEGVGLSAGTLAMPGAVERVEFKNRFNIFTIGNRPPVGFCASGYIDLLAILLRLGLLTEYGMLKREMHIAGFKVTQMDIRKLQLAIGAIHTGIKYLLDLNRTESREIKTAVITGEFGSHLNIESLKKVGLIPAGIKNIQFKKDLPLNGAVQLLLNNITFDYTEKIREKAVHIELALQKDFQKRFVEGLILKRWN